VLAEEEEGNGAKAPKSNFQEQDRRKEKPEKHAAASNKKAKRAGKEQECSTGSKEDERRGEYERLFNMVAIYGRHSLLTQGNDSRAIGCCNRLRSLRFKRDCKSVLVSELVCPHESFTHFVLYLIAGLSFLGEKTLFQ
jgi:hypothetical protein